MRVNGIFGAQLLSNPPRFVPLLKKLITVWVEKPLPLTVIVEPTWVTDVTEIRVPSTTDTALLCFAYELSEPLFARGTTRVPYQAN